jgi:hypothetical protein
MSVVPFKNSPSSASASLASSTPSNSSPSVIPIAPTWLRVHSQIHLLAALNPDAGALLVALLDDLIGDCHATHQRP